VREVRKEEPMTGCKKVHNCISAKMIEANVFVGRDRFIDILGEHGMHIKTKRKFETTTYSRHPYAVAPNLVKNRDISRPNEVYVADITYVRLSVGFAYLFLVTDLYSRKIVGYSLSRNLKHDGAIEALRRSLKGVSDPGGIIHHSDRGCQYCCHEFLDELRKHGMESSMTDENHCYQNAVAERVNGILKLEYFIDSTFKNYEAALAAIDSAVYIYNNKRTHWSLKLRTPEQVYSEAA